MNLSNDVLLEDIRGDRDAFLSAVSEGRIWRPYRVKFKVVDYCNARCVMCNHWRRNRYKPNLLTHKRLMDLTAELRDLGTRWVTWSGGEPTLRPDLPEVIGRLSEYGIGSKVMTNGTMMSQEYAARLLKARVRWVAFSLESANPEIHDHMVGFPGAWQKILAGAEYLCRDPEAAPRVCFQAVLTSLNIGPGLLGLPALAARAGVHSIELDGLSPTHLTAEEQERLIPSSDLERQFHHEYLPRMRELSKEAGVKLWYDGDRPVQPNRATQSGTGAADDARAACEPFYRYPDRLCYLPFFHCTIDHQGNAVACCHLRTGPGAIGNIQDGTLGEILQSAAGVELRRRLMRGDLPAGCRDCSMGATVNRFVQQIAAAAPAVAV